MNLKKPDTLVCLVVVLSVLVNVFRAAGIALASGASPSLKAVIERQLDNDPELSADDTIIVRIDHQKFAHEEVMLDGIVTSWKDDQIAVRDAFVAGASQVVSRLVVRNDPHGSTQPRAYHSAGT